MKMKRETFKISVHPDTHNKKPDFYGGLTYNYKTSETTLDGLIGIINDGHSICTTILLDGHRDSSKCVSSQVIFLDYDGIDDVEAMAKISDPDRKTQNELRKAVPKINQNPKEKIALIESFGLKVNIFYNSFSHSSKLNKFRLCIVFDDMITDLDLLCEMKVALINLTDADVKCSDPSRMFYAGNNAEVLNPSINSLESAKTHFTILINKDKRQNHKHKTHKKFKKLTNGVKVTSSLNTSRNVENTPNRKKRNFNFKIACDNSLVFNGFDKGSEHLHYAQLFNLATNLQYVRGGEKYFKEKLLLGGTYKPERFDIFPTIKAYDYKPERIFNFDSALDGKYHNVLELDGRDRNDLIQIRDIVKEKVDAVYDRMKEVEKKCHNSINRVSVILVPTGSGKTKLMIEKGELVASPTNALKEESYERALAKGIDCVMTPNPPVFVSKELQSRYDNLQSMEESSLASSLVKDVSKGLEVDGVTYTEIDTEIALNFKDALEESYTTDLPVYTTHSRIMLTPLSFNNKSTLYFDEDIYKLLMNKRSVDKVTIVNKLDKLINSASKDGVFHRDLKTCRDEVSRVNQNDGTNLRESIQFIERYKFFETLASREGFSQLAGLLNTENAYLFTDSDSVARFYYGEVKAIPEVFKKVIVFSATANKKQYDRIFEKNGEGSYDFFHCGYAINLHPIKQNLKKSWSKKTMGEGMFPEIDSDIVITHKKYAGSFEGKEEQDVYFGNTEGIDKYKGKDISVVGNLIEPINSTIMECILLGLPYETNAKGMVTVTTQNFKFKYYTFIDANLRDIEISNAESHSIQAVGRARTTRTKAKVDVHSTIPISDADDFEGRNHLKYFEETPEELSTIFIEKKVFSFEDLAREFEEAIRNDDTILYDYSREDVIQLEIF